MSSSPRDGEPKGLRRVVDVAYEDDRVVLWHGDCLDALKRLDDASVDAVVTDPPYELGFMGKRWDASGIAYRVDLWAECLRVLKPGGHLLAFGGTRTWHRLTCAVEDAGFEIRDTITWLYGSGFPKSLDVSKAIDRGAGAEREVVGRKGGRYARGFSDEARDHFRGMGGSGFTGDPSAIGAITAPATEDAARWQGWGTALKPASEPVVVARKPLDGTVAATVLTHGTGALNIDGCRVVMMSNAEAVRLNEWHGKYGSRGYAAGSILGNGAGLAGATGDKTISAPHTEGRWPSNVVLTHAQAEDGGDACADGCVPGCPVADLDAQSGVLTSGDVAGSGRNTAGGNGVTLRPMAGVVGSSYADTGGASRFFPTFRYQAKAPTRERPKVDGVAHPTVKPLALMSWLVRLVTLPGGTVLDPFAGSGTTVEAALAEGFRCVAVEREAEYLPLVLARIERQAPAIPDPATEPMLF